MANATNLNIREIKKESRGLIKSNANVNVIFLLALQMSIALNKSRSVRLGYLCSGISFVGCRKLGVKGSENSVEAKKDVHC
jgi:hypothetical protein